MIAWWLGGLACTMPEEVEPPSPTSVEIPATVPVEPMPETPPEDTGGRGLPDELAPLMAFVFEHAADDDTALLEAGVTQLRLLLVNEDLTVPPRDRAVILERLDGERLGGLSIPDGSEAMDQVSRGLATVSTVPFDDHVQLALEPNRVCIEHEAIKHAMRAYTQGEDCFPQTCSVLRYEQPTFSENPLFALWYDQRGVIRLVDVRPEGGVPFRALVHQFWIEERGADQGQTTFDVLFGLDVSYESSDEALTRGFSANWSWVDSSFLGPTAYGDFLVDSLAQRAVFADEFILGLVPGRAVFRGSRCTRSSPSVIAFHAQKPCNSSTSSWWKAGSRSHPGWSIAVSLSVQRSARVTTKTACRSRSGSASSGRSPCSFRSRSCSHSAIAANVRLATASRSTTGSSGTRAAISDAWAA